MDTQRLRGLRSGCDALSSAADRFPPLWRPRKTYTYNEPICITNVNIGNSEREDGGSSLRYVWIEDSPLIETITSKR